MVEKETKTSPSSSKTKKSLHPLDIKDPQLTENKIIQTSLDIKYSEFDPQKGRTSPRMLFRKRKNEDTSIFFKKDKNNEDIFGPNAKPESKVSNAFEALLDYVREIYFTTDGTETKEHGHGDKFKFTSLDLLLNPLRKNIVWETWSPYEIALFDCCMCKFGTDFDLFLNIITTKKKEEIIDFYYIWKGSKYYKMWKNKKGK